MESESVRIGENMLEKLKKFVRENIGELFVTGGSTDEKIKLIEKELDVKLCDEYKEFLQNYGMLIGYGIEVLGSGKSDTPAVVTATKRYRELGLSKEYIVIQSSDEWVYCIDLSENNRIISWDRNSSNAKEVALGFEQYILCVLNEGKEVWEE